MMLNERRHRPSVSSEVFWDSDSSGFARPIRRFAAYSRGRVTWECGDDEHNRVATSVVAGVARVAGTKKGTEP